jgi:hypothetical protein
MSLAELQRRFHAAVTRSAPLDPSLLRDDGIDSIARLHVYTNAYFARIAGVLAADYPKLHAFLGEDAFRALVVPYLRAYPTRHPSLREAGACFSQFLRWRDPNLADLARLERARVDAFDGADAEPLAREDLAALEPAQFPALKLALVPTAALVDLATNADETWDALERGGEPPPNEDGFRAVLVWRRDLDVVHRTLERDEVAPLRRLTGGATFAEICEHFIDDGARALELLVRWLDAGILAR